ncbi:MAG: CpsD/CapB family tyrosine-protein kinase [Candidatus Obscuribacterales bacterium]|nr:CpsD/CapB family tyrosine-protein kinase [Steroidobacteraceae bacterium]
MRAEFNNDRAQEPDNGAAHAMHALVAKRQTPAVIAPAKPTMRLLIAHDPFDPHCENVRALRTELLLRRETVDQADVVALLSPGVGEGRSQLAAELAISFAQLGRPTLLVDADLRHPNQHVLFGAGNPVGLSQAIERGGTPHLHSVEGLRHLSLLTAGPAPDNPLELLLNSRFAALIEEWRRSFDFVILDTAPVTHYSDGLAVASLVGRVIALSRAKHTPYKDSRDMLRRLAATRSQIVGAVINHF